MERPTKLVLIGLPMKRDDGETFNPCEFDGFSDADIAALRKRHEDGDYVKVELCGQDYLVENFTQRGFALRWA